MCDHEVRALRAAASLQPVGVVHFHTAHLCEGRVFPDEPDAITRAFEAAGTYDVVLSSGGVSVGDHDHVKPALARAGVALEFWRVAMKPGKPLAFGRYASGTPVFGLPGNPASCMVNVALFVWPLLRAMQGDPRPHLPRVDAELEQPVRRSPGRPEYVRVALTRRSDGTVTARPAGPQGSASLLSLSGADGLAVFPAAGDVVEGPVTVIVVDHAWERRATG
jgi:molybdopterin molybdotransferase